MAKRRFVAPFLLPVIAFAGTIFLGAFLLWLDVSAANGPVSFVDTLFISTSAVCVTGLASVDPSTVFNRTGHSIMMVLVQLGGLGIVTYSTLIFYMFSRRVSLGDRLAVGQALLLDTSFHLGKFLQRIVIIVLVIEFTGAALLYCMEPEKIGLFNAAFLAVSGFCNAGFALWPDNLIQWQQHWGVNLVIMGLIIVGGLGFFVIDELLRVGWARLWWKKTSSMPRTTLLVPRIKPHIGYNSRLVLTTSFALVGVGALVLFFTALGNPMWKDIPASELVLPSLFQSVTSRTAGFATVDMVHLSDISLLTLAALMLIGGSPGSCAGGIKTTTFRALCSYIAAQLRGHRQVLVQGRALEDRTINKVMLLFYFSILTIFVATFLLTMTENGVVHHGEAPFQVLDLLFEVVSAFGTVGLSVNVTPQLSPLGKIIICCVMFIGRLGPIWLITTVQQFQSEPAYRYPEVDMPIG